MYKLFGFGVANWQRYFYNVPNVTQISLINDRFSIFLFLEEMYVLIARTGGQDVKFTQCKVWHLDVGLSFPKSVGPLIVGSADLF